MATSRRRAAPAPAPKKAERVKRPRFDGGPEIIANAIDMRTAGDIVYTEAADDAKVNPRLILAQTARLRNLKKIMPTFSFKKTDIIKGVEIVLDRHQAAWKLNEQQQKDFKKLVPQRLLNLIAHVAKEQRREKPSQWFQDLFKESILEEKFGDIPDGGDEVVAGEVLESVYGMDMDQLQAYKHPKDDVISKEWTSEWERGPGQWAIAVFKGERREIAGKLNTSLPQPGETTKKNDKLKTHFSGRSSTGATVYVKIREDKNELGIMAMWVGGKQKCSIKVSPEHTEDRSVECMKFIAEKFCGGELDLGGLYKERDRWLAEQALPPVRIKRATKKPAGAGAAKKPGAAGATTGATTGSSPDEDDESDKGEQSDEDDESDDDESDEGEQSEEDEDDESDEGEQSAKKKPAKARPKEKTRAATVIATLKPRLAPPFLLLNR